MKLLYCVLFYSVIFLPVCYSQKSDSNVIRIDALPASGVLLEKGWKFHAGDNPDYADPNYDDGNWQTINTALDIHDIPQLWKNKIVWFRLYVTTDSSVVDALGMTIEQSGASEIYLNGELIQRFGRLSDTNSISAYDPSNKPFYLGVLKQKENVIALRYALQPGIKYSLHINRLNPAFIAHINKLQDAFERYKNSNISAHTSNIFRVGVFIIFLVLHLAFYIYYPEQKANLYFSIYALLALCFEISQFNAPNAVGRLYYNLFFTFVAFHTAYVVLLTAIYELIGKKRGTIYWSLIALTLAEFLSDWFTYKVGDFIQVYIISNLITLETVRVSFLALKQKQRGAWIIVIGAISFAVFWSIFVVGRYFHFQYKPLTAIYGYGDILSNLALLSMPVATSIYLGLEFAFTNTVLKNKIAEIKVLSKKNIEQEKEKQQILASQNEMLEQQVTQRTAELKYSLENLKSTQAQLIQSEKMASLGELTAGIAHEIQNPLNFVNNFSEVNKELIHEASQANTSGNSNEVAELLSTLKDNEEKINHHGKRADAIVKGMLQHSRTGSSTKEPTDINRLADEYLRLAYQGFRARDKTFNATFTTEFDSSVGNVNIVPQEIGRVILNLVNNAFYAVNERAKQSVPGYEPSVIVGTRRLADRIEVSVKDNGNGIPGSIIEKIFQPFFTTKPTGQGTGLGLSLAYDIVTKGHGGELKVETKEDKGSVFIIYLPGRQIS